MNKIVTMPLTILFYHKSHVLYIPLAVFIHRFSGIYSPLCIFSTRPKTPLFHSYLRFMASTIVRTCRSSSSAIGLLEASHIQTVPGTSVGGSCCSKSATHLLSTVHPKMPPESLEHPKRLRPMCRRAAGFRPIPGSCSGLHPIAGPA